MALAKTHIKKPTKITSLYSFFSTDQNQVSQVHYLSLSNKLQDFRGFLLEYEFFLELRVSK